MEAQDLTGQDKSKINQNWLKWDHIHPMVYQSLLESGFAHPTEVQSYVLSTFKHHNDFIVASQTGSGKTLSFGIPILSEILHIKQGSIVSKQDPAKNKKQKNYLRAIIVAPTRELAMQIEKHLKIINKKTEKLVSIIALVGGISKEKQKRLIGYQPDIIVCTPGRLWDMIETEQEDYLQNLDQIDYFVMDEADRMIELGHFDDLDKIVDKIFNKKVITHDRQILEQLLTNSGAKGTIEIKKDFNKMFKTENQDQEEKKFQKKTNYRGKQKEQEIVDNEDIEIDPKFFENEIIEMDEKEFMNQQKSNKMYEVEEVTFTGGDQETNADEEDDEDVDGEGDENEDEEDEDEEGDWDINEGKHSSDEQDEMQEEDEEEMDENDQQEDNEEDLENEEDQEEEEEFDENEQEEEEDEDEENIDNYEEGQDQLDFLMTRKNKIEKKNTKKKIFLVSATITNQFKGKQKFKITKKEIKQNKDKLKKENDKLDEAQEEKKEAFNLKIQALLKKIKFSGKPKLIDLTAQTLFPKQLRELKSVVQEEDKILYLYHYIQQKIDQNFIIFCNSISYAKKVTHLLEVLKLSPVILHSEMQQRQRLNKLDKFKNKKSSILVCTDVAARGLDIPKVQNVVHYQVPMDIDTYVHRSGRTARIGQEGTSYVLIGPKDAGRYNQLCKQLEKEQGLEGIELTLKERDSVKKLVESAVDYEKKQYHLAKKQQEAVWYKKVSKQADIELDDEIRREMEEVQDEIVKKRVISEESKEKMNKVVKNVKNIDRSRRNALFLDPTQINDYAQKIKNMKDNIKKQKEEKEARKKAKQQKNKVIAYKTDKEEKHRQAQICDKSIQFRRNKKQQKIERKGRTKKIFGMND